MYTLWRFQLDFKETKPPRTLVKFVIQGIKWLGDRPTLKYRYVLLPHWVDYQRLTFDFKVPTIFYQTKFLFKGEIKLPFVDKHHTIQSGVVFGAGLQIARYMDTQFVI